MLRIMLLALLICGIGTLQAAQDNVVKPEEKQKISEAMPDKAFSKPAKERRILVFSLCNGFKHSCVPYWKEALQIMSEKTGAFKADFSDDMGVFTEDNLKKYDAVCLNNSTKLKFTEPQQKAFMDFVKGGRGVIGIHAATDNFDDWQEAREMMGGYFTGHPWTGGGTWAVKIDQPDHPLMKMFGGKGFKVNDEIYRTAPPLYSRDKQLVLMSLDMSDEATKNAKGVVPDDMDTGISWIKMWGKGRVFYCSLGHNHHLVWTPEVLRHYLAGIQFALGDYDVPVKPVAGAIISGAVMGGQGGLDTARMNQFLKEAVRYEYGKSRLPFSELGDMITANLGNAAALAEIEKAYCAALLDPTTTYDAKDYLCRQLSLFGSDASVDVLGKLLNEPKTQDIARYALQRISGNKADQLLLDTLSKTSDVNTKLGIISTLGFRKTASAAAPLAVLMKDSNKNISAAAINTLGRIGTQEAANKLLAEKDAVGDNKAILLDALLTCANQLDAAQAKTIFEALYAQNNPSLIRAAALRGIVAGKSDQSGQLITAAMKDKDSVVSTAAVSLVKDVKDNTLLKGLLAGAPGLTDDQQVKLLAALRTNGLPAGKSYAEEAVKSQSLDVRIAAFSALEKLGDAESVELLAKSAAALNSAEQESARKSLDSLGARGVDEAIAKMMQPNPKTDQDKSLCCELIRTAGQRKMRSVLEMLLGYARSGDNRIKQEAVRSLQLIAEPSDMPALVKLLMERPDAGVQGLVVSVAGQNANSKGIAKDLVAAFGTTQDKKAQAAILGAIGKTGDTDTVDFLRKTSKSADSELSAAAFRAMSDWPGDELIEDMIEFAKKDDLKQSVIAIRSAVRMITSGDKRSNEQKAAMLGKVMDLCKRPEDKKLVLGGLSSCGCPEAAVMAGGYINIPELKMEAQAAVISAAEKINGPVPEEIAIMVEKIASTTDNDQLKQKAQEIQKRPRKKNK